MTFVVRSTLQIAVWLLFLDAASLQRRTNFLHLHIVEGKEWTHWLMLYSLKSCVEILSTVAALTVQYRMAGVVTVATGLGKPGNWPDAFGSVTDAYTIRRFWK